MCSLIVPNVPQPEMMVTKGGEIIEKDTGARKIGRLFCGPDFIYLGVQDPKLGKWFTLVSGAF